MFTDSMIKSYKRINSVIKFGLYLNHQTDEEKEQFLRSICQHVNEIGTHDCYYKNLSLMLENKTWDRILEVSFKGNKLYFRPINDTKFFEAFLDIVDFISMDIKKKRTKKNKETEESFEWI